MTTKHLFTIYTVIHQDNQGGNNMKKKQTTLRQEPELNAKLKVIAERKKVSFNKLIVNIIERDVNYHSYLFQ